MGPLRGLLISGGSEARAHPGRIAEAPRPAATVVRKSRREDMASPRLLAVRAALRERAFLDPPGMDLDREAARLHRRVGRREGLGFLERRDLEDEDSAQIAVVAEGPRDDQLLGLPHGADVRHVGFLHGPGFRSLLRGPARAL